MFTFKNTLIIAALTASTFSAAASANAQEQVVTQTSPVQYSNAQFGTVVSDAADVKVTGESAGVTTLEFINPNGLSKKQQRSAKRCYSLKPGKKFINSGRHADGTKKYFPDVAKKGENRFCDFMVNGKKVTKKVNCGNDAFTGKKPPRIKLVTGQVRLVRYLTWTANITVTAKASILGAATAECKLNGNSASSSVFALGTATATATGSATVRSKSRAISEASANGVRLVEKEKVTLSAQAQANAEVLIGGEATAYCVSQAPSLKDGTQTPPTPTTAPGTNPAPADNVSSKCYDEITGKPVASRADGTCPAGSYGA